MPGGGEQGDRGNFGKKNAQSLAKEKMLQLSVGAPGRQPSQTVGTTTRHTLLSRRAIAFGQRSTGEAITTDSKSRASPESP